MSCEFIDVDKGMPLIRAYLPPSTLDHLPNLEEALNRFPDRDPVVLGELNADIGCLRNPRNQKVADFLALFGIVDLLDHFIQCLHNHKQQTCWQVRQIIIL